MSTQPALVARRRSCEAGALGDAGRVAPVVANPVVAAPVVANLVVVFLLPVLLLLAGCGRQVASAPEETPLQVFGAASLSDALVEVAAAFEAAGGPAVELNLAGSNALARQIVAGAPADFFVSADAEQMKVVEAAGRVRRQDVSDLLGNRLVVVVPASSTAGPLADASGLEAFDRLALADPVAVPAGVYAQRWLEGRGLWPELEGRVVPTADVRAALAAVAGGHLPAGIVYATDAASESGVRVVYEVPEAEAPPIRYQAAPIIGAPAAAASAIAEWQRFLRGAAVPIFERHGFTVLGSEGG